jgi:hypothetical protein
MEGLAGAPPSPWATYATPVDGEDDGGGLLRCDPESWRWAAPVAVGQR